MTDTRTISTDRPPRVSARYGPNEDGIPDRPCERHLRRAAPAVSRRADQRKSSRYGDNEVINMPFGVNSEVGRLRQVMVHRPGLEYTRLTRPTPENCSSTTCCG